MLRGPRERLAREFVLEHHYAASMPVTRVCVGLFHKRGVTAAELVCVENCPAERDAPSATGHLQ